MANRNQINQKNAKKKKRRKFTKPERSDFIAARKAQIIKEKLKENPPETLEDIPE